VTHQIRKLLSTELMRHISKKQYQHSHPKLRTFFPKDLPCTNDPKSIQLVTPLATQRPHSLKPKLNIYYAKLCVTQSIYSHTSTVVLMHEEFKRLKYFFPRQRRGNPWMPHHILLQCQHVWMVMQDHRCARETRPWRSQTQQNLNEVCLVVS